VLKKKTIKQVFNVAIIAVLVLVVEREAIGIVNIG